MPTCDFDPQPACFWHRAPTGRSEYPDGMTPCEPPAFEHAMLPPNVAAEFDQVYATIRLLEARIGELEAKFEGAPTVGLVPGGEPKPGDATNPIANRWDTSDRDILEDVKQLRKLSEPYEQSPASAALPSPATAKEADPVPSGAGQPQTHANEERFVAVAWFTQNTAAECEGYTEMLGSTNLEAFCGYEPGTLKLDRSKAWREDAYEMNEYGMRIATVRDEWNQTLDAVPHKGGKKPSVDFNALFDAATLQAQERQPERSTPCPSKS